MDKVFIRITYNGTDTWIRADQILGIDENAERTLVKVAYMPNDFWLQSDEAAEILLSRIQMSMERMK